MHIKEIAQQDILSNLLIKSKKTVEDGVKQQVKYDHKLNYSKVYDNPKYYEVSYIDALANLQEVASLFKKRINDKNQHYNFFLDDNEDPYAQNPITPECYEKYQQYLQKGKIYAYTLKNTWTKGKQFFFINKGCVIQVVKIYEDRIFGDVSYKNQIGLMKLQQLKIIVTDDDI